MRRTILEAGATPEAENNRDAIQSAIEAVHAAGGGMVIVPSGRFQTGGLILKSRVTLHLEQGAVLRGTGRLEDYPPHDLPYFTDKTINPTCTALIFAEDAEEIAITGRGTLDGHGEAEAFRCHPLDDGTSRWHKPPRPWGIRFHRCRRALVSDIRIEGTAEWAQHYADCDHLRITGVEVYNHRNANNDGLDIDGCRDVIVSDCVIDADDDAISLKSTQLRPCEDVLIHGCILASRIRPFHIGSETTADFRRVRLRDCVIRPSHAAEAYDKGRDPKCLTALCVESKLGGVIEDFVAEGLTITGYVTPLVLFLAPAQGKHPKYPGRELGMGGVRGITVRGLDLRGQGGRIASSVVGQPDRVLEDVRLLDWRLDLPGGGTLADRERPVPAPTGSIWNGAYGGNLPAHGLYARDVKGLEARHWRIRLRSADARPAIHTVACPDARLHDIHLEPPRSPADE